MTQSCCVKVYLSQLLRSLMQDQESFPLTLVTPLEQEIIRKNSREPVLGYIPYVESQGGEHETESPVALL